MDTFLQQLEHTLATREKRGLLRSTTLPRPNAVDFSSNDYLGFSRSTELHNRILKRSRAILSLPHSNSSASSSFQKSRLNTDDIDVPVERQINASSGFRGYLSGTLSPSLTHAEVSGMSRDDLTQGSTGDNLKQRKELAPKIGSTGSRLLSGNSELYEAVENKLCEFHEGEAALLFNSGYDLNLGFFGCVPQKNDIVVFDELVHNSMREGFKLSRAKKLVPFVHNSPESLRNLLQKLQNDKSSSHSNVIVAIESVYSMDGHCAPIQAFLDVCADYGALLVVDEAHGLGVFGRDGRGLIDEVGCDQHPNLLARIYTFGKALGAHGAVCICSSTLRTYLLNYCRPLIYSTSLSFHSLLVIDEGYEFLKIEAGRRQEKIRRLVKLFRKLSGIDSTCKGNRDLTLDSYSPIQGILCPGNDQVNKLARILQNEGFDAKPIRTPTVPEGSERIRIILHYHNTEQEVINFVKAVKTSRSSL